VFALAGKDLSRPIKKDSFKMKKEIIGQTEKMKKEIIGQTEEKILEYLKSMGISNRAPQKNKTIQLGIPYTAYRTIPKPDVAPLANNLKPTFLKVLTYSPPVPLAYERKSKGCKFCPLF
jgi:hypothetical protein